MSSTSQPVSHLWAFVQAVPVPGMPGKSQPSKPTANMALSWLLPWVPPRDYRAGRVRLALCPPDWGLPGVRVGVESLAGEAFPGIGWVCNVDGRDGECE